MKSKPYTRLHFFRDSVALMTRSLDEQLAEVASQLTASQREASFVAFEKLTAARDAVFVLINELDDVQYKKVSILEEMEK